MSPCAQPRAARRACMIFSATTRWTLIAPETLPTPQSDALQAMLRQRPGGIRLVRIGPNRHGISAEGLGPHGVALVRPDRHIGLIVDGNDLSSLQDYLDLWCPASSAPCGAGGVPDRGGPQPYGRADAAARSRAAVINAPLRVTALGRR